MGQTRNADIFDFELSPEDMTLGITCAGVLVRLVRALRETGMANSAMTVTNDKHV